MALIRNFWGILTKYQKKQSIYVFALMILVSILETFGIALVIPVISTILEQGEMIKSNISNYFIFLKDLNNTQFTIFSIIFLLIFYLIKSFIVAFYIYRKSKLEANIQYNFSSKLFHKYLNFPYEFHIENNSSFLLRNVTQETDYVKHAVNAILTLFSELFIMIGIIIFLLAFDTMSTSLLIIFFLILYIFYSKILKRRIKHWGDERFKHTGILTKQAMEGFGIIKILKLMNIENIFFEKFSKHSFIRSEMYKKYEFILGIPRLFLEYISILALLSIVVLQISLGKNNSEIIILLALYGVSAFKLIPSLNKIFVSIQAIEYNSPSIKLMLSMFADENRKTIIKDNVEKNIINKTNENIFTKNISFKDVYFKFPKSNNFAVEKLNFEIKKGEVFGICGASGAGKSTIIDLIIGLLKPSKGEINIDDINLNNINDLWQNYIGYVPQYIYLTDESIKQNISFGRKDENQESEKVKKALKLANLDTFVDSLKDGLETKVGEKGVKLSGGQKQRIGIARALYNDPKIIILDEATNQLDEKNEREIINSISSLKNKTVIIVSHNKSALENCNKFIRLDSGSLVE